MSKGKRKKRNKKDNRNNNNTNNNNTNNRNEFIQHPDSRDKEDVQADKTKTEEIPEETPHEKKSCFGRIMENIMVALVAGVIVWAISITVSRYFLSPRHIDISTSQDELNEYKDAPSTSQDESTTHKDTPSVLQDELNVHEYELFINQDGLVGEIDQCDEKCQIYFMDSERSLIIDLDNNSDIFMRITDICVNVIKCTDITEEDITIGDVEWSGDAKRPIFLKTKIEHHTGKMEAEIDLERNPEYGSIPYSYIMIPNNTGEKFVLSMDFEKQGYYNIEVEFNYMYDGKPQTIKTDPLNFIFIEKNIEDSLLLN